MAVGAAITRLSEVLDAAPPAQGAPGDDVRGPDDVVAEVLRDYLTAVGPVQLELTVERQFDSPNGPLTAAMTQLGLAFRHFHAGNNHDGLAALRAARQVLPAH